MLKREPEKDIYNLTDKPIETGQQSERAAEMKGKTDKQRTIKEGDKEQTRVVPLPHYYRTNQL